VTDYRLRLFVVRIIYTGPDANGQPTRIGPPSEQDMVNTLSDSFATRTFPISGINYTGSIVAEFNGDLRRNGSVGCGAGWLDLLKMLGQMRAASSSQPPSTSRKDVYLGLLQDGFATPQIPRGTTSGCGDYGGWCAAFSGESITVAHELGHAYGRRHTPCANDPGETPFYPYPDGSIGEWGFGSKFLTLIDPKTTFDLMGAGVCLGDRWVSIYTYENLFDAIYRKDWSFFGGGINAPSALRMSNLSRAASAVRLG
jgi:hypothetical protein